MLQKVRKQAKNKRVGYKVRNYVLVTKTAKVQ